MNGGATARYVIDGRFLAARPTGLHRVARSFVVAARDAGLDAEVWAPTGTTDALADRLIRAPHGRVGGRVWEQIVLPVAARGRPIWSLTNTAPLVSPGVVVVHDLAANIGPEWFAGSMRTYASTVLASARRARRVITVSKAVRGELIDRGVHADRIVVVSPEVDPRFAPTADDGVTAARARHGLSRPYALVVGWADPRKDALTAIAAHNRIVDEVPHDLVLLGESHPSFAPVRLAGSPSVRRLGHVPDDDLVALLTGAAVLLYPSRYEGFGLPPLEAMACGTPAVASDIPALRESTAGRVRLATPGDVDAWAAALRDGLLGRLRPPSPPIRATQSVGQQLVAALSPAAVRSRDR
jgi:glycosyltransferase involved in cell wall biosynthesis